MPSFYPFCVKIFILGIDHNETNYHYFTKILSYFGKLS